MAVALKDGFEYEGHLVTVASEGAAALREVANGRPDVVILDVMLPKVSGMKVCKQLRESGDTTPIIMLTARGQEIDKVLGLRTGADDYVTKPFSFMELVARVEAVLRRTSRKLDRATGHRFGTIEIDFRKLKATRDGAPLDLSAREFALLEYFVKHAGVVVTRDELLNAVWGYDSFPLTRTVDMHIARLRQKVEDNPSQPAYIITVHRMGYKFIG